jgi:hypothetical protein
MTIVNKENLVKLLHLLTFLWASCNRISLTKLITQVEVHNPS